MTDRSVALHIAAPHAADRPTSSWRLDSFPPGVTFAHRGGLEPSSMQNVPNAAKPSTSIYAAILDMDAAELDAFRRRLRRRYGRDELLAELRGSAARLGASPTMRQFAEDPQATIHPQTIVDHFGSWNTAKREAGLMVRRRATDEELLEALRSLGTELGRRPSTRDMEDARGRVPSRGVYTKAFGSMAEALRLAGFEAPSRDERLTRSIEHGAAFLLRTGRLPSFRDWERVRGGRADVMTAWQLYRTFERLGGAWSAFQFAVSEQADDQRAALAETAQERSEEPVTA